MVLLFSHDSMHGIVYCGLAMYASCDIGNNFVQSLSLILSLIHAHNVVNTHESVYTCSYIVRFVGIVLHYRADSHSFSTAMS